MINLQITWFEKGCRLPTGIEESTWCVTRQLPSMQSQVVARFTSRGEAEVHRRYMKHLYPHAVFEIIFDVPSDPSFSA